MTKENNIKKIISFILLVLIIVPTVLFSVPGNTYAQDASDLGTVPQYVGSVLSVGNTAATMQLSGTPMFSTLNIGIAAELAVLAALAAVHQATAAALAAPPHHSFTQNLLLGFSAKNGAVQTFEGHTRTIIAIKTLAFQVLQQAIRSIEKQLLRQLTQSTVNWINSGFHGSPLFVQNTSTFFANIGKSAIIGIVNMTGYNMSNYPFGRQWDLNVINSFRNASNNDAQMSLGVAMRDPSMLSNFSSSGWNGFLNRTQYPQNNVLGYNILADQALANQLKGTVQNQVSKVKSVLQQGMGFLSPTTCPSNPNYNTLINEFSPPVFKPDFSTISNPPDCIDDGKGGCTNQKAVDAGVQAYTDGIQKQQSAFNVNNACPGGLKATTPGSVVAGQITTALGSTFRQSELGAALGNSIGAVLDALMNHFLQKGLTAMSNAVSNNIPDLSSWNYAGQTLMITNSPGTSSTSGTSTMVVPESVTVQIGSTTPATTISGGTPPYSIVSAPDSSIAAAQIGTDGVSLTATGVGPGQTTFTVEDSSSPTQTATVQVTSSATGGLIADFDNPSALQTVYTNISSDINNPNQTTITLQGGTPPYSIATQPDSSLALALIGTDTSLEIIGTAAGTTSVTLQDSSTPAITIPLQINIGAGETPLSATPTSIAATSDGSTTNVTISGGTPPYSIATEPDSGIATAIISDNNLSVIGEAVGTTSIVVQDSFSPAQTISIPITNSSTPSSPSGNCTVSGTKITETQSDCTAISGTWTALTGSSSSTTTSSTTQTNPITVSTQNVSVSSGSKAIVTISGGSGSYSIVKSPNFILATTSISGNVLTISGLARGITSVVVQDTSNPSQSVDITINVTQ